MVIVGSAVVSLAGVAAKPTSWFTHAFPGGGIQATAAAAGHDGRVFATSPYADWVLWNDPQLAGRVAFDTRFELLSSQQLDALGRIESASGDWRKSLRGYRVFVLGRKNDQTLARALRRDLRAPDALRADLQRLPLQLRLRRDPGHLQRHVQERQ